MICSFCIKTDHHNCLNIKDIEGNPRDKLANWCDCQHRTDQPSCSQESCKHQRWQDRDQPCPTCGKNSTAVIEEKDERDLETDSKL